MSQPITDYDVSNKDHLIHTCEAAQALWPAIETLTSGPREALVLLAVLFNQISSIENNTEEMFEMRLNLLCKTAHILRPLGIEPEGNTTIS